MVSYISSFFFDLVEKNLLRVKKFSKCRENGIACLRKGKLRRRRRRRAYAPTSNTASHGTHEKINSWVPFSSLIWVWGSAWRAAGAPLSEESRICPFVSEKLKCSKIYPSLVIAYFCTEISKASFGEVLFLSSTLSIVNVMWRLNSQHAVKYIAITHICYKRCVVKLLHLGREDQL